MSIGLEAPSVEVRAGSPLPFGAHQHGGGVNFALFSRHATGVLLELYDSPASRSPTRVLNWGPTRHRTGDIWHVWVQGIAPGQLYGFRIDGPYQPVEGHRFNVHKLLLDPLATAVVGTQNWNFEAARSYGSSSSLSDLSFSTVDNAGCTPKCMLTDAHFDWESDLPPRHPTDAVIYETHVRGFTIDPSSRTTHPGTCRGLVEKIPYYRI
jgi:isoamylase